MKKDILIIGAGLTGLTLAHLLKNEGYTVRILEARNRIGGRIHTLYSEQDTPIEMGATWLSHQHSELLHLLETLHLPIFEQFMEGSTFFQPLSTAPPQQIHVPVQEQPSYRIQGGTQSLIDALVTELPTDTLILNEAVHTIQHDKDRYTVNTTHNQYHTDYIITTLPPALLLNSIQFTPNLPEEVYTIAAKTHTWMGQSIKFGVGYDRPFWKEKKYSGAAFSNSGPITEVYDHTNHKHTKFALKGFLTGMMATDTKSSREAKVIAQLEQFFGTEAKTYLTYEETIWNTERYTIDAVQQLVPHQNNGHPVYQNLYFNNTLYIAGSETSPQFSGYMEGAIRSALAVYQKIKYPHTP